MGADRKGWLHVPGGLRPQDEAHLHACGIIPDDQHEQYLADLAEIEAMLAAPPTKEDSGEGGCDE